MQYDKTTFINNQSPPINKDELNKIGGAIEKLAMLTPEKATFNSVLSNANNFIISIEGYASPPLTDNLPLVVIFTPLVSNATAAKVTASWGVTQYPIFDTSTNTNITDGEIRANQPSQFIFDGSKFWFVGGGRYLQYGITTQQDGYWHKGTAAPVGATPIVYNGVFKAAQVWAAVYNSQGADIAECYPVCEDCEFGDLISINNDGRFVVTQHKYATSVLGFVSHEKQYAACYGTDFGDVPIAEIGRILAKVSGKCSAGQYLTSSDIRGAVMVADLDTTPRGAIVAQALESKDSDSVELTLVKIVRM